VPVGSSAEGDAALSHAVAEGGGVDAEELDSAVRSSYPAVCGIEGFADRAGRGGIELYGSFGREMGCNWGFFRRGSFEGIEGQGLARALNEGAPDGIFELPHVARLFLAHENVIGSG
jgi:hypothetical protein